MSNELKVAGRMKTAPVWKPRTTLTRFDVTVSVVILALLAATLLTVIIGDRIGVRVLAAGPISTAHSTSSIFLQFTEDMDQTSVESRLLLDPPLNGNFRWNGRTLIFQPATAMSPGTTYTVSLPRGAASDSGRQTLSEYRFNFTVMMPRVAYLTPSDSSPTNIWIADPRDPQSAHQLTFSPTGIYDFSVSPDGTRIAFSEIDPLSDSSEIKVLDIETGGLTQITNCTAEDARCTNPVWRPDGSMMAYERIDLNSDLTSVGVSPTRVWLLDLSTTPASTRPLFTDTQMLGYSPVWSGDGTRLAVFDTNSSGILVYSFADSSVVLIPSRTGSVGTLSPDGTRLVFPEMLLDGNMTRSTLKIADLVSNDFTDLTSPDEPIDDVMPIWNPDGYRLAIGRQYLDNRFTRGSQMYLYDTRDSSVTPLVIDERYTNGFFSWDATGQQLVLQRFPELDENGNPTQFATPEVWTYDLATDTLTLVATNANRPRWIP
ncbi:MAG: Ig-like domain-containing protein [Anaerolineae bacterium]